MSTLRFSASSRLSARVPRRSTWSTAIRALACHWRAVAVTSRSRLAVTSSRPRPAEASRNARSNSTRPRLYGSRNGSLPVSAYPRRPVS